MRLTDQDPLSKLPPGAAGRRLTLRELAVACCCALFLAVQLGVPLAQLWAPRPARFGWQMYSVLSVRPRFTLLLADGSRQEVDITAYTANMRGDMAFEQFMPPHLCRQFPRATAIEHERPGASPPQRYICDR
jgi:hypothetical protein